MKVETPDRRPAGAVAVAVALLVTLSALPVGAVGAAGSTGVQGTVTITDIQQPTGSSGDSPYAGQTVTTTGTVTAVTGNGFFVQDGTGAYSGVYVFGSTSVSVGDAVEVTGLVKEYNGLTEIDVSASNASVTVTGTAPVPAATTLSTANASAEAYEGVRVEVANVTVTATPGQYGEWGVTDGSAELRIDDVTHGQVTVPNATGGSYDTITGPLFYSFGEFKLQPESAANYTPPSDDGDGGTVTNGTTLTLLAYNDIQTAASNPEKMGRLVGAVNSREAAIDNPTVVVGGGDQVSPSSLSPVSNWTVPVATLNVLDPAAEVVGNHDLDYGFAPVANYSAASEFPWLVANIEDGNGNNVPGTEDYTIVQRGNLTVGIVGLVDEAVKSKTAVDFDAKGYRVTDYAQVGSEIAADLKNNRSVDVVVAAAHVGIPEAKTLARSSDDIDAIVVGDDEVAFEPETVDGTVIVEAEARAAYLGEVNLTVGNDSVGFESGRLIALDGSNGFPINATANATVANARGQFLSKVAGRTTVPLDSTFASNYDEETAWGNTITDAFRAKTGAQVAITNSGGIRGNFVIPPGNVTYDDVYTSLPFGNYLVTKEMTGEQLREFLASQVDTLDAQFGGQAALQVSGVTYEFVDRPGAGTTVTDVYVNGQPLVAEETYSVTVNSYMAGWTFSNRYGWDMADLPTLGTDYTLYGTATVQYVRNNSPISPSGENRIRRVTRDVGDASVSMDGETTTLTYGVPAAVSSVDASSVRIENATGSVLRADSATLSEGTLSVTVRTTALRALADDSTDLQLYATYNDSVLDSQRNGFDRSVLNGDLSVAGGSRYDVDGNGAVEFGDVTTVIGAFNTNGTVGGSQVTFQDVLAAIDAFNAGGNASASV